MKIKIPFIFTIVIATIFFACSNSEYVGNNFVWDYKDETGLNTDIYNNSADSDNSIFSSSIGIDNLPFDDTEYPYTGIPRIVIETENHLAIRDRETEIPAKLQIWGKNSPESDVMFLSIRGRGNTSWEEMPKKSYKIEFINKQAMLGMPKDRDWALIANYADKTLMKNYLMYHLSAELGAYYAPRCEFVELYLNKEYLGVYLLTETIKIAKQRINIPENDNSYIVEIDARLRDGDQVVFSHIIRGVSLKFKWHFNFQIHQPQNASQQVLDIIENHIQSFETYLTNIQENQDNHVNQWIDIDEYVKHYWVQEFSKNPDADFKTSVYFSWIKNDVIKMGPVWDFDIVFGGHVWKNVIDTKQWLIKDVYWNHFLFQDSVMKQALLNYWHTNESIFSNTLNIVDSIQNILQYAAINNFKRWNILQSTESVFHSFSYLTYEDATNDLKEWIKKRISWIDSELTENNF
ncbi:CotH kinase family protein [Fibrobacter sp. UWH4]|uniref:CotH kinase family protein n=1 Tax=Fibrobacter sp. UWH4 TaxID=1896210 RepID=UPI0009169CE6|nr:CotH kinase family protein [Fibrobacter sp. UWH4]SHL61875.1 CotH protein [Fibrobacter sp. UWH4]